MDRASFPQAPDTCPAPSAQRRRLLRAVAVATVLGGAAAMPGVARADPLADFVRDLPNDDVGAVRQLLRQGLRPDAVDAHGNSALYLALQYRATKVARLLLAQPGIRLDQPNSVGETPLMIACLRGENALAEALVARGARVDPSGDAAAWTPLSYAATGGDDAMVKFLLAHGARVDRPAANGTTPLMMAAYFGHTAALRSLLAAGANPRLRNAQGFTAMDLAMQRQHHQTAEALGRALDAGRKPGQW